MQKRLVLIVAIFAVFFAAAPSFAGPKLKTIPPETVAEMRRKGEPIMLVQINAGSRTPAIQGAIRVQEDKVGEWAAKTGKDTMMVVFCTCPSNQAGDRAAMQLEKLGFRNVYVFDGGLKAWYAMVKRRQEVGAQ